MGFGCLEFTTKRVRQVIVVFGCSMASFFMIYSAYISKKLLKPLKIKPSALISFKPKNSGTIYLSYPTPVFDFRSPNLIKTQILSFPHNTIPPKHPVTIVQPGPPGIAVNPKTSELNQDIRFLVYQNTFFTSESVIFSQNTFYVQTYSCHPRYWEGLYTPETKAVNYITYESVVCVGHQHSSDFGHWFLEVFPALCALPREAIDSSVIVLPRNHSFVYMGLKQLGVADDRMVFGENQFYFASTLYSVHMINCGDLNENLIVNFRIFFAKKFNLDQQKAHLYLLFNRPNMSRCIGNYDEIFEMLRSKYPQFKWENGIYYEQLIDQARYFNQIKLIFTVHGSVLANIVFMQQDMVVCDLHMKQVLFSFLYASLYTGLHYVCSRDGNIEWRDLTPNILDINQVQYMIGNGLILLNDVAK